MNRLELAREGRGLEMRYLNEKERERGGEEGGEVFQYKTFIFFEVQYRKIHRYIFF